MPLKRSAFKCYYDDGAEEKRSLCYKHINEAFYALNDLSAAAEDAGEFEIVKECHEMMGIIRFQISNWHDEEKERSKRKRKKT